MFKITNSKKDNTFILTVYDFTTINIKKKVNKNFILKANYNTLKEIYDYIYSFKTLDLFKEYLYLHYHSMLHFGTNLDKENIEKFYT